MDLMSNGIVDLMSEGLAGVGGFYCIQISLYFMCFKSDNFNETFRITLLLQINFKDKYDLKKTKQKKTQGSSSKECDEDGNDSYILGLIRKKLSQPDLMRKHKHFIGCRFCSVSYNVICLERFFFVFLRKILKVQYQ